MRFLLRSLEKIGHRVVMPLFQRWGEWQRLADCLLTRKPYIGPLFAVNQLYPPRGQWMRRLIQNLALTNSYGNPQLLEIGSWAGQSALLWADALHKSLPQGEFGITCIDPWKQYLSLEMANTPQLRKMYRCVENERIFNLFLHNINCCGLREHIHYFRGESDEFLPILAPESFDVAYVDGSHFYDQVVKDMRNVAPLVKDGGYLCGDDLDLQLDELSHDHVKANLARDVARVPWSLYYYHPGVSLALWEFFGRRISVYDGFWVVRKQGNRWVDVTLPARADGDARRAKAFVKAAPIPLLDEPTRAIETQTEATAV